MRWRTLVRSKFMLRCFEMVDRSQLFIARSFLSERVQMNAVWMGTRSLDRDRIMEAAKNEQRPTIN